MKTSSAKQKGRILQQWIRDLIIDLGEELTLDDVRSCSMGSNGEDVLMSPLARIQFPVSIECKNIASFAGYKHLEQAEANCPKGSTPIAVIKANRKKPVVLVDAEYFFNLLKGNKWKTKATKNTKS